MPMTQPIDRIEYTDREMSRFKDDVELWKSEHTGISGSCWVWEDLIAKANFLFDRLMRADVRIQQYILVDRGEDASDLADKIRELLRAWSEVSLQVFHHRQGLQDCGPAEGLDVLEGYLREAKSILTPDDEYFDLEKLSSLRDEAIEAHRLGQTESVRENERPH